MYEVAPVAGNKVEAACALRSLQAIMGQISSNHHSNTQPSNRHHANQKSKIYYRHSTAAVQPLRKEEMAILRDPLKETPNAIYRGGLARDSVQSKKNKDFVVPNGGRPITISEMNAYNIEKSVESTNSIITTDEAIIKTSTESACAKNNNTKKANEFYTVGDGYHKTETCFFRSPDGNFHKLPTDSFHKMSEGCYVKTTDGSFRRLETPKLNGGSDSQNNGSNGSSGQTKVKNQMMRFLKRSKSHTPATLKEMQKEKDRRERDRERDRERERKHRASYAANGENSSKNNKVVVTMMENGGLPIVATSKASKHTRDKDGSNSHHSDKSRPKVRVCN